VDQQPLRIGVYVDGFNLFYGGREFHGADTTWMWLDIRALINSVVSLRHDWAGSEIVRVVYCTAEVTGSPDSLARQQQYHLALRHSGSVDYIAYGEFQTSAKESPVALRTNAKKRQRSSPEVLTFDEDPLPGAPWTRLAKPTGHLLVSHQKQEEKGTDVNVASHLLIDVLEGAVNAAVVVTNDSDLEFAIMHARTKVPVGVINPRGNHTAGKLRGEPNEGVGRHWWHRITADELLAHPLPDSVGKYRRPADWSPAIAPELLGEV